MSFIVASDAFIFILVLVLILEAISLVLQHYLVDFEGIQKMKKDIKALQEKQKQAKGDEQMKIPKQILSLSFSMMKYQKQYIIASFVLFPLFFFALQNHTFMDFFSGIISLNAEAIKQTICSGGAECVGGAVLLIFGISLNWFWTYLVLFMVLSMIGAKLFLKY
ncbi:MAG: hypothetical protein CVU81_00815 [Euryarchaeota archaeon HGW-Euryarchaeota-1]|nr:MAG: hypothetical protein CVU81_00815 [Euryarchaeota archaeon HGW-Euryarchaeota-1]